MTESYLVLVRKDLKTLRLTSVVTSLTTLLVAATFNHDYSDYIER
jgi:hypothetical protein